MTTCRCWAVALIAVLLLPNIAASADAAKEADEKGRACLEMKIHVEVSDSIALVRDTSLVVTREIDDVNQKPKTLLRVIDLKTAKMADIDAGLGSGGAVETSPDGALIAVGRGDNKLQIWDWMNRRLRSTSKVDGNDFVVFDPNGKCVYTAERLGNGVVDRVDAATGRVEHVFGPDSQVHVDRSPQLYGQQIRSLSVLPDGKRLFITMPLGAVVWDVDAGHERSYFTTEGFATSIAINHDGTQAAVTMGNRVRIVDVRTRERVAELTCDKSACPKHSTTLLVFSPDDKMLVGGLDGGMGVPSYLAVSRDSGYKRSVVFPCQGSSILALRFIPGTHRLVTPSVDGTICIWDLDKLP
jgi:WD40 repeat protein